MHVWTVSLDREPGELSDLEALLAPPERERAGRFRFDQDRRRFIAGRGFLRRILGRYVDQAPEKLSLVAGRRGKPSLPGSSLQFNLSHSDALAVVAVAHGRAVGVDIEHVRPVPGWQGVMKCCFSPGEQSAISSLPEPDQQNAFLTCWTRKEAYVKATGDGLGIPLDRFTVSVEPDSHPRLLEALDLPDDPVRWRFTRLPLPHGYFGVAAHDGPIERLEFFQA
jgi:4'-phosphopantetheinyl transferase